MTMTKEIEQGTVVYSEGNFSDTACIIESGSFEVSKKTLDGGTKIIGILKKNDIFGEMGILDGLPRSATVVALEDSKVTIITKEDFENLSRRNPNALMPILKVMSMRLRRALKKEALTPELPHQQPVVPVGDGASKVEEEQPVQAVE